MERYAGRLHDGASCRPCGALCLLLFSLLAACVAPEGPEEHAPKSASGASVSGASMDDAPPEDQEIPSPGPSPLEGGTKSTRQSLPLPDAREKDVEAAPRSVEIFILITVERPRTYGYRVNGKSLPDLTALGNGLNALASDVEVPELVIRPEREVPYEQVVKVVNLCWKAGLNRITITFAGKIRDG